MSVPFDGSGTNVGATSEVDETNSHSSVWWKYTPTQDGILTIDTFGSTFYTSLDLWTGSGHPLSQQVCGGQGNSGDQTQVQVGVISGETYYLRLAGVYSYGEAVEGDVQLNVVVEPPITNDDFADAIVVSWDRIERRGQTWAAVPSLFHDEGNQTVTGVGLSSFSQFAVGDDANPLPVESARFLGERQETNVQLTWKTASETNNPF